MSPVFNSIRDFVNRNNYSSVLTAIISTLHVYCLQFGEGAREIIQTLQYNIICGWVEGEFFLVYTCTYTCICLYVYIYAYAGQYIYLNIPEHSERPCMDMYLSLKPSVSTELDAVNYSSYMRVY